MVMSVVMQVLAVAISVVAYLLNPENAAVETLAKMKNLELFVMPALAIVLAYFYLYAYVYGGVMPSANKPKNKVNLTIQCSIACVAFLIIAFIALSAFCISKLQLPGLLVLTSIVLMLINWGNDLDVRYKYKETVKKNYKLMQHGFVNQQKSLSRRKLVCFFDGFSQRCISSSACFVFLFMVKYNQIFIFLF